MNIIFDFDGTLANTLPALINLANKHASKYGFKPITNSQRFRELGVKQIIFKELKIPKWRLPILLYQGKKILTKEMTKASLFPYIKTTLQELRKHHTVGIISSNTKPVIKKVLQDHQVEVDFIHAKASLLQKERTLARILIQRKLSRKNTVYIADEVRDVIACKRISLPMVGVSWGYNTPQALKKSGCTKIIKNPKELLSLFPVPDQEDLSQKK